MSYRKKHIKRKISKIRPRKPVFFKLWFWMLILILVFVSSVAYFLFFYPGFQVENIIISGNERIKTQDLYDIFLSNIDVTFINIGGLKLTTRNILFVRPHNLNEKILEKHPIIEEIKVNKKFPQTLVLEITERKPIGVYCANDYSEQQCFLIDKNGIVFEALNTGQPLQEEMFIVRQAMEDENIFTGKEVIARNVMNMISVVKKTLKDNFQIDIEEALITSPLRLNIKTSENWQIYFTLDSDIDSQIIKLNFLLGEEILPEIRKKLEYIDLRFKDRAYYK